MYGFNLSTYSYTRSTVKGVIYSFLFFIIVGFSIYNYSDYGAVKLGIHNSRVEINKLNKQITSLKKDMKEKVGDIDLNDEKGIKKLSAKIDFLNAVIYENNFSWSELFYSLEKASPRNVSIHSVKPSYESRKIKIAGLAKKSKDVATLVDNLEKTSFIKKSFLLGESEEIIEKRYRALSFNIEAEGDF